MAENSVEEPLLLNGDVQPDRYTNNRSLFVLWARRILKTLMWVVFFAWIAIIFLYPGEFGSNIVRKWEQVSEGTPFGVTGSLFMIFSGPIIVIAFLAIAHLIISGEETFEKKKNSRKPAFRLWTFPVLVDGPFGVVSATEFIGIILFIVFIIWAVYAYAMRNLVLLDAFDIPSSERGIFMIELMGLRMGMIGQLCLAFLFLPISRGSVLLRIIDIPFEHATRYHVWLGHLTMALFTIHGLFYVIAWAARGNLVSELLQWSDVGIANLPGVISLSAGLLMWVTSLHPVRKQFFELFFYTHQLYIVFVVFLALHVGDFLFSIVAGGIFLFILDRFLRFFQSRRTVDLLSAKCLPCGTVELVFSKPASLRYNALSFIFIQARELSWLQWHPFSVSSSPLDGRYHISVLIKVLGGWTAKLRDNILSMSRWENEPFLQSPARITASVEGPYGHESPYHLMYENLVLVAGGIGISPFLAILSDIVHRSRDGKPCLPRRIMIVWAIKKSNELSLLQSFLMESICPSISDKLSIETNIYITRESVPSLEEGQDQEVQVSSSCPISSQGMSVLVGTGDNIWSGLYVILSTVGFIILMALLNIFYINPYGLSKLWLKGLIFIACMVASVVLFGGTIVGLWHIWERKVSAGEQGSVNPDSDRINGAMEDKDVSPRKHDAWAVLHYGSRPDFKEIFGTRSKKWGHVDVGVMVCGPPTLQTSIAREIRSHNLRRQLYDPIFHFNSHSFDL